MTAMNAVTVRMKKPRTEITVFHGITGKTEIANISYEVDMEPPADATDVLKNKGE